MPSTEQRAASTSTGSSWRRAATLLGLLAATLESAGLWVVAGWLALFWALVVRARIELGFWPYPMSGNPVDGSMVFSPLDPGHEFPLHQAAVLLSIAPLVTVVPLAVAISLLSILLPGSRPLPWMRVALVALSALAAWQLIDDPGGFLDWAAD